jgi:hypothetical protein
MHIYFIIQANDLGGYRQCLHAPIWFVHTTTVLLLTSHINYLLGGYRRIWYLRLVYQYMGFPGGGFPEVLLPASSWTTYVSCCLRDHTGRFLHEPFHTRFGEMQKKNISMVWQLSVLCHKSARKINVFFHFSRLC